jgi:hypothetical protein
MSRFVRGVDDEMDLRMPAVDMTEDAGHTSEAASIKDTAAIVGRVVV